jgi:hypothetical protein
MAVKIKKIKAARHHRPWQYVTPVMRISPRSLVDARFVLPRGMRTCDALVSDEAAELGKAINEFKRVNGIAFASWSHVLFVMKALGYSKVGGGA